MPFKSGMQMQACYKKQNTTGAKSKWDCDKWLEETPNICTLPGFHVTASRNSNDRHSGPIQIGPRGGVFFIRYENECEMKIYLPHKPIMDTKTGRQYIWYEGEKIYPESQYQPHKTKKSRLPTKKKPVTKKKPAPKKKPVPKKKKTL